MSTPRPSPVEDPDNPVAPNGSRSVNIDASAASHAERRRAEAEHDRELLLAAQQGDSNAFKKLVEKHQRRVFSIAYGMVRDKNDAHEISQEAFFRVYKNLDTFQGASSFYTWLYRIVSNLCIDLLRKPGRANKELFEDRRVHSEVDERFAPIVSKFPNADPIRTIRQQELSKRLEAALDELPSYHRGVILMREVEGLSYEQMAEAMGVSKGTIMSRLFHARQKLQRALQDCYNEEIDVPSSRQDSARTTP